MGTGIRVTVIFVQIDDGDDFTVASTRYHAIPALDLPTYRTVLE